MVQSRGSRIGRVDAVLDGTGPAVVVPRAGPCPHCGEDLGTLRVPAKADDLQYLGRRATAVAYAQQGVPPGTEAPEWEPPHARIWPPRLAVEVGIPDALLYDDTLTPGCRLMWVAMWRMIHVGSLTPTLRVRAGMLAKLFGVTTKSVYTWLLALEARGWITNHGRAEPPAGYGELRIDLFVERRAVETTAGERKAAGETVNGDEDR